MSGAAQRARARAVAERFRRRKGRRVESKYFGKREPRGATPARRRRERPMDYKAALRVFGLSPRADGPLLLPPSAEGLQRRYRPRDAVPPGQARREPGGHATGRAAYEVLMEALRRATAARGA